MSTKHNTKHYRKASSYPRKTRGVSTRMPTLYELRKRPGATLNDRYVTDSDLQEVRHLHN